VGSAQAQQTKDKKQEKAIHGLAKSNSKRPQNKPLNWFLKNESPKLRGYAVDNEQKEAHRIRILHLADSSFLGSSAGSAVVSNVRRAFIDLPRFCRN
jgi:hypothetical protein